MPLRKKQKPKKFINIALTDSNHEKLKILTKYYGLSQQDIINELIRDCRMPKDKNCP